MTGLLKISRNVQTLTPGSTLSLNVGGGPTLFTTSAQKPPAHGCPLVIAQRYVKEAKEDNQENFAIIFQAKRALFLISEGVVCSVLESILISNLCGRM